MPRSGSTLIEQILASHPLVYGAGEVSTLDRLVSEVPDAAGRPLPLPALLTALDAQRLGYLARAYLASLPRRRLAKQ